MSLPASNDGFLTCYRCGADVVKGALFCPVCGAPQDKPRATGRPRRSPRWVPAAIVAGAIAAIGAGALLAFVLDDRRDPVATDPSPSASETASLAASQSTAPSESASPTPEPAAVIPNLGIAQVVTDVLNLRSQPDEGASVVAELATDRRLFIVGEPTESDDMRWYRVATVADANCPDPCDLIGYVSTPVAAEDSALEEVAIDCPNSPMTLEDLGALAPLEALHCYGRNEIVVTGTVASPIGGYEGPFAYSPVWLAHPLALPFLATQQGATLGYRPHPDSDLEAPEGGDVVRVTGHYEDPAATSCRVTVDPAFADEDPVLPNPALVVLTCRATFAWTDYEVTGE